MSNPAEFKDERRERPCQRTQTGSLGMRARAHYSYRHCTEDVLTLCR